MELIELTVTEEFEMARLDQFLAGHLTQSRTYIQKLIKAGQITINGNLITRVKVPVHYGDFILINIPDPEKLKILPEDLNLDILYEDEDVLVVNKPKGMVVHPAPGHTSGTLVNGLMYHCKDHLSGINGVLRPGIVHRIDKDTTGALIVCKNDIAHQSLALQLKEHTITRRYNAIVWHNFTGEEGTIDKPIARHPVNRKKMSVMPEGQGKRAVTHYNVLDHLNKQYNFIECHLETGRTHQIRVHMSYINHPLLGDEIYGPATPAQFKNLRGQTLHARILGFKHPRTNQYIEVEAPLPPYFVDLLEALKK